MNNKTKKVLFLLSEYGYWGEEFVGPYEVLKNAGYTICFATPNGKRPNALPPSMDPFYMDPPLGKTVVSKEMAEKVKMYDQDINTFKNIINLSILIPVERPYISEAGYLRNFEKYNDCVDKLQKTIEDEYDALVIVGGSGPIIDLVNNQRVHDIILSFLRLNKVIAAECYGVACLAFARDLMLRKSIIWGKHVTGHPLEYDYKADTGFYGTDFVIGPPPYPLEYILRDAVGPDGAFIGNVGKNTSVIVDYPFITGRSTPDSYKTGELLVEVLENGLKRYGW